MADRLIKCNKCGKRYPSEKMKYVQDIKNLMCLNCLDLIKNPKKEEKSSEDGNKKRRFRCNKCKHTFMLKQKFNKQCPFCGGFNLTSQEWNSDLDSLINDSSDPMYDR